MPRRRRVGKRRAGDVPPPTVDQEFKLMSGLEFPPGSAFESEGECRSAWEMHREELIAEARDRAPGQRPWAFWRYDAAREQFTGPEIDSGFDNPYTGVQLEDREAESIGFLAAAGYLTADEIMALRETANEAATRIDTEEERRGAEAEADRVHGPDRRAVKVWEAVEGAVLRLPK